MYKRQGQCFASDFLHTQRHRWQLLFGCTLAAIRPRTKVDFIRSYVPVPDTDEESVQAAAELINNAERPLVLV